MNKDDEFKLNNNEYDDDARAVKESELLPIYEVMNFSGDIQPLEDFKTPEPERVEYQQKKKAETKGTERKREKERETTTVGSAIKRIVQIVVAAAISLVIIGVAGFGIYTAMQNRHVSSPAKMIYSSGGATYLALLNDKTFEIGDAQNIKASRDGSLIYFCKTTSSKTGIYDIKLVDASKKNSLKRGGSAICIGAEEDWNINADGTLLYYCKKEKGVTKYYLYNAKDGKSVEIASEVEEVFLPTNGDIIYYTRRVDSTYSLHRFKYGEPSTMVASGVGYVKFCDSDEGSEVIYTAPVDEAGEADVFSVKQSAEPVMIASKVSEVYLNDYVFGGNLYYFKKRTSNVSWQDFINDKYAESDAAMKKPVESDYMIEYGFFIKRYLLNESAFDAAKAGYKAKLKRDAVREALDKLELGMDVSDAYDCCVYNAFSTQILATGVYLDNVLAHSPTGAPRIVVRKSVINVKDKISMDKLMSLTDGTDATDALDYVRRNVGRSHTVSDECVYSWFDGNKVQQYGFTDYKDSKTIFYPATSSVLYGFFDGKLYCDEIADNKFGRPQKLAEGVSECAVYDSFAYYQKQSENGESSLYRYSPETGEQHLGDNISSYIVTDKNSVILLSVSENTQSLMNMGLFDGKEYKSVDTDISINHFIYNKNTAAYLKIPNDDSSRESGDMYICTVGSKPVSAGSNVSDIKYINDTSNNEAK